MRGALTRKVLAAALGSVSRLARAARGADDFDSDRQIRSCVELVRLVPALFGKSTEDEDILLDTTWWTPERLQAVSKLWEARQRRTREENAESWAAAFRRDGPFEPRYSTEEEARDYGRSLWDHSRAVQTHNERIGLDSRKQAARRAVARRSRI